MADNEASVGLELGVGGGIFPANAKLAVSLKRGWNSRGQEALDSVTQAVNGEVLEHRLLQAPEVEVLLARAVNAAAASSLASKRRLLARVVQAAVLDDAAIDQSTLILDVLEQVDAVHVRCLEAIARAELESKEAGDWEFTAERAEKPSNQRVQDAADGYPSPIIKRLETLGLADASVDWSGHTRVTGMTVFGELVLNDLRQVSVPDP
jgi:hypothetical protein